MTETIAVDLESLSCGGRSPISGCLWFCVASPFPEAGWFDFPVVLLAEWLVILRSLAAGVSTSGTLRFRDGPFAIRASATDDGRLTMELVEIGRSRTFVRGTATFELSRALDEAISVARSVVAVCTAKEWQSEDLDRLRIESR